MSNILFSITCYENVQLLLDQIKILNGLNDGASYIVYLSEHVRNSPTDVHAIELLQDTPNVVINSSAFNSGFLTPLQAHISNVKHTQNFDRVCFLDSADQPIRQVLADVTISYDDYDPNWFFNDKLQNDPVWQNLCRRFNIQSPKSGTFEGTVLSRELLENIIPELSDLVPTDYPQEEVFIQSIVHTLGVPSSPAITYAFGHDILRDRDITAAYLSLVNGNRDAALKTWAEQFDSPKIPESLCFLSNLPDITVLRKLIWARHDEQSAIQKMYDVECPAKTYFNNRMIVSKVYEDHIRKLISSPEDKVPKEVDINANAIKVSDWLVSANVDTSIRGYEGNIFWIPKTTSTDGVFDLVHHIENINDLIIHVKSENLTDIGNVFAFVHTSTEDVQYPYNVVIQQLRDETVCIHFKFHEATGYLNIKIPATISGIFNIVV